MLGVERADVRSLWHYRPHVTDEIFRVVIRSPDGNVDAVKRALGNTCIHSFKIAPILTAHTRRRHSLRNVRRARVQAGALVAIVRREGGGLSRICGDISRDRISVFAGGGQDEEALGPRTSPGSSDRITFGTPSPGGAPRPRSRNALT